MAERNWTPVKMDWDKDVGIVGELNLGLKDMNGAADLETLTAAYGRQRENAKHLMPEGRKKWEQAYAMNVLRLTKPDALAPDSLYVAIVAEAKGQGVYDYAEAAVYSTLGRAVCSTLASLAKSGDLYERMSKEDLETLAKYVSAAEPDWMLVYDHIRQKTRGMLVTVMPQELNTLDDVAIIDPSKAVPVMATVVPERPRIKHSTIEHRFGNGGKGEQSVYLVAEMHEFVAMLTANDLLIGEPLGAVLDQIHDCISNSPNDRSDKTALEAWADFAEE